MNDRAFVRALALADPRVQYLTIQLSRVYVCVVRACSSDDEGLTEDG